MALGTDEVAPTVEICASAERHDKPVPKRDTMSPSARARPPHLFKRDPKCLRTDTIEALLRPLISSPLP